MFVKFTLGTAIIYTGNWDLQVQVLHSIILKVFFKTKTPMIFFKKVQSPR